MDESFFDVNDLDYELYASGDKWVTHPTEYDLHDARQADVDFLTDLDSDAHPIYWELVQSYRNLADWERVYLGFNGPALAGGGEFW